MQLLFIQAIAIFIMGKMKIKKQHLFEIEIFYNIIDVFTVSCIQQGLIKLIKIISFI